MGSKTLKYLSYSMPFVAIILLTIFNLLAGFKINIFIFIFPAVLISYFLKKLALKKTTIENRDSDYTEAIEKEINTSKWAVIMLLGLGIVELIYKYS